MEEKLIKCTKCNDEYPLSGYYKSNHNSQPRGYILPCKVCRKKYENSRNNKNYYKNRLANLTIEQKQSRSKQLTERARERRKDPLVRLKESIRTRIYNGLKDGKDRSTEKYLGCDISNYKIYLESKFTQEMSWDNYGEYWEIDHIKPICKYNLSIENEMEECFHYSNTQPLTKEDNRVKSGKY